MNSSTMRRMLFAGNPGTGKSTEAKLIAGDLYSIGMLRANRLVIAERTRKSAYWAPLSFDCNLYKSPPDDIVKMPSGG